MVGVPRSKGCRTCVQRRIKCDQTRPSCQRCQKRGLTCPGYGPAVKFQDETTRLRQHYEKRERVEAEPLQHDKHSPQDTASSIDSMSTLLEADIAPSDSSSELVFPQADAELIATFDSFLPSPHLVQTKLLGQFIDDVSGAASAIPTSNQTQNDWLKVLTTLPSQEMSDVLNSSIRAFVLSYLGRTHQAKHIIEASRQQYGLALRQLAQTMRAPQNVEAMSSKTLSATILLSFYEMFHATAANAWIRHAGGAGALLRARGPERADATLLDRVMFMAYRNVLIIQAFEAGTHCFLTEPAWAKVSRRIYESLWDGREFTRIGEDYHDEMAYLPAIALAARQFPSATQRQSQIPLSKQRTDLKRKALRRRIRLKSLYEQMCQQLQWEGLEGVVKPALDLEETMFPNQLHHPDVYVGGFHCSHWTVLSILNVILVELMRAEEYGEVENIRPVRHYWAPNIVPPYTSDRVNPDDPDLPSAAQLRAENMRYATDSCSSVDYMSNSSFHGPVYLTFALRVATLSFPGAQEKRWVYMKLRELGRNMGLAADMEREMIMARAFMRGNANPNEKRTEVAVHKKPWT